MKEQGFWSLPCVRWILWGPVFFPLAVILFSFLTGVWSWGLMDDMNLLTLPGTIWQRFLHMPIGLGTDGRLQPVYTAHAAVFYKIFANHPQAFFVFRWFEVLAALAVWGALAARLTRRWWAAPLFMALALTLDRFYDAFFYLSLQEILGVFFSGLALWIYFQDTQDAARPAMSWARWSGVVLCFILAVLSKETFVACPMALGLGSLLFSFRPFVDKTRLIRGGIFFLLPLLFAVFLKVCISRGYSSDYVMNDPARLIGNLWQWGRNVLPYHIPAAVICGLALFFGKRDGAFPGQMFLLSLAGALYVLYLLVILPWNATGHYALPLGVFAALGVTICVAPRLDRCAPWTVTSLAAILFVTTAWVGGKALYHHETYQYDTAHLLEWMRDNALFRREVEAGLNVRANAAEPSVTIPASVKHDYGMDIPHFIFTANVREILSDPATRYFLWGTSWGNQDLRRLGEKLLWYPVFTSKHWIMFRRAY